MPKTVAIRVRQGNIPVRNLVVVLNTKFNLGGRITTEENGDGTFTINISSDQLEPPPPLPRQSIKKPRIEDVRSVIPMLGFEIVEV